jgi:MoaA/NifB/PqqE/SkfB family radical SAM enzyme
MRTIHWQLTFRCNLDCRYCWNATRTPQTEGALPPERLYALLEEIAAAGQDEVLFTGGEPFMVEHLMEALEVGLEAGLRMRVFTNGTLLSPRRVAALERLARRGPLGLVLSLDAVDPAINDRTRGAHDVALRVLDLLHEQARGLEVTVNTVLTAQNLHHAEELPGLTARLGVREHRFDLAILHPRERYPAWRELDLREAPAEEIRRGFDRLCSALDRFRSRMRLPPAAYYLALRDGLLAGELPHLPCRPARDFWVVNTHGVLTPCFERTEMLADLQRESFGHALAAASRAREATADQRCFSPRCICSFIQHPQLDSPD